MVTEEEKKNLTLYLQKEVSRLISNHLSTLAKHLAVIYWTEAHYKAFAWCLTAVI